MARSRVSNVRIRKISNVTDDGDLDLHIVAREELLEFRLSSRVGEVPNVQPTALHGTSQDIILVAIVLDGGFVEIVGEIVDGRRHCG